jgi:hypothetical protein
MVDAHGLSFGSGLLESVPDEARVVPRARHLARHRMIADGAGASREFVVTEIAPVARRDAVRLVAAVAIGVNIALALIDVWRATFLSVPPGAVRAAFIAVAFAIPLHIRHVIYGLRGERPPAGAWTFGALLLVHALALRFVGDVWVFQFASLAVSALIVVRGAGGIIVAAIILLSPLVIVGPQWFGPIPTAPGFYLTFALVWRTTTQIVPIRLLTAIRALDAAGRELEARVVVQARVRIDGELRTGVAGALQNIVARGNAALGSAHENPALSADEVRRLTSESRRALADARWLVARYRGSSSRAEVDAVLRDWGREAST